MARTLYRIFLYLISTVLLGFAAFGLDSLLNTLLRLTGLRGAFESAPSSSEVVQNIVLAAIALVVFLALGGPAYWLIRRDIAQEPSAARGAVRSLFLNLAQAVAALVAFYAGASVLRQVWQPDSFGVSGALAATLVAAAVFALEQIERSRSAPAPGAPMVLQRLHLYGVQVLILLASIGYWLSAIDSTVKAILTPNTCEDITGTPSCNLAGLLLGQWLAVLWAAAAWGLYTWLARGDTRSVLRKVAQYAGFIAGLISVIVGVERAAELGLRSAFGVGTMPADLGVRGALAGDFDFFAPLLFGLVAMVVYGIWLTTEAQATPLGQQGTELTTMALAAVVLGVPFYIAIGQLLHGFVESAVAGTSFSHDSLAASLALLISGLAHPFIAFELRRRTTKDVPIGPRRGFVLAGLAAGALAGVIGGAIALYLVITAQLGSPVSADWPVNARTDAVVFLVGGFVAGIHLWRTIAERSLVARPTPAVPSAAGQPGAIESVLDELLAGRITREQAAARIQALTHGERGRP